jgi:TIGR03009 family protein
MTRAGLILAAVLAASPAFAQAPPATPTPPGGAPMPTAPAAQPGGGAHLPVPGAGAPAAAQPAPPIAPEMVAHLAAWEKVMQGATNFYCKDVSVVRKNLVLKKESAYSGEIMCLKPNMARMRLQRTPAGGQKADPNDYTAYICTGQEVYEYDGQAKVVTEYKLRNGGVGDNLLLEFMSGSLKTRDVLERFELKHLQPNAPNYIYLEIKPRLPRDKAEFETMILVLFQPNIPKAEAQAYLPRTVVIRKNNGQEEETWDFPMPAVSVPGVTKDHFKFIPVPKELGWKMQQAQQPSSVTPGTPTGQPRVVRPNGP